MIEGYYVYCVFVDGEVRYIGKGKGDRWKHAISGASSVPELNRDHFTGKYIEVRLFSSRMSEQEAFQLEADLIQTAIVEVGAKSWWWHPSLRSLKMSTQDSGDLYNKVIPEGSYLDCPIFHRSSRITKCVDNNGACKKNRNKHLSDKYPIEWESHLKGREVEIKWEDEYSILGESYYKHADIVW